MRYRTKQMLKSVAELVLVVCILSGWVGFIILCSLGHSSKTHEPLCYNGGEQVVAKGHATVPGHESIRPGEKYYWYVCAGESER